jgi:hypothetical protein
MAVVTLETKKVRIQGVQWTGENVEEIEQFVGEDKFYECSGEIQLYNVLEEQWINCPKQHYVLRGLKGEFYPCEEEALFAKYIVVND